MDGGREGGDSVVPRLGVGADEVVKGVLAMENRVQVGLGGRVGGSIVDAETGGGLGALDGGREER